MNTYLLTVWDGSNANGLGQTYNLGRSNGLYTPIQQAGTILAQWHANGTNEWTCNDNGAWENLETGHKAQLSRVLGR